MEELRALGLSTVPVTVVGDNVVIGYRPNDLSRALALGRAPHPRGLDETTVLLQRALEALGRVVRDMPPDRLEWQAPGRSRPMRELTYHIFVMARSTIAETETGESPYALLMSRKTDYHSFGEIWEFGAGVTEAYRAWVGRQDLRDSKHRLVKEYDNRTTEERIDWLTGPTVHPLRQLYWVLGQFGVEPTDALRDEQIPKEYILPLLGPGGSLF